jgi:hypothetical protein
MLDPAVYSWRCTLCEAFGHGGASAFAVHYRVVHQNPTPTYQTFLIEAREEHGLKGTAAYQWAHAAYVEYVKNH